MIAIANLPFERIAADGHAGESEIGSRTRANHITAKAPAPPAGKPSARPAPSRPYRMQVTSTYREAPPWLADTGMCAAVTAGLRMAGRAGHPTSRARMRRRAHRPRRAVRAGG